MTSAPRGGGGVSGKADEVRELSKGGCVNFRTSKGGRGSKNPKILRTSLMEAPLVRMRVHQASASDQEMCVPPRPRP